MPPPHTSPLRDILMVGVFLGMITAPLLDHLLDIDPSPVIRENRVAQPWPGLNGEWSGYPERLEAYYQDHFGPRKSLIRGHAWIMVFGLGVSPSERVVMGRDGWLFLDTDVETSRSVRPLGEDQLIRWQTGLEQLAARLEGEGVGYLLVIAPASSTVYPDKLPAWGRPVREETLLDQFFHHMQRHSPVPILDLRPSLQRLKPQHRLYHRTDTHWNDCGAYGAYEGLIERVREWFPDVAPPWPLSHFSESHTLGPGGDLAGLFALTDVMREERLSLVPTTSRRAEKVRATANKYGEPAWMRFEVPGSQAPTVLMVHDSYTYAGLYPLLAEHFARIDFVWRRENTLVPGDVDWMESAKPDLVIQEVAERILLLESERGEGRK